MVIANKMISHIPSNVLFLTCYPNANTLAQTKIKLREVKNDNLFHGAKLDCHLLDFYFLFLKINFFI